MLMDTRITITVFRAKKRRGNFVRTYEMLTTLKFISNQRDDKEDHQTRLSYIVLAFLRRIYPCCEIILQPCLGILYQCIGLRPWISNHNIFKRHPQALAAPFMMLEHQWYFGKSRDNLRSYTSNVGSACLQDPKLVISVSASAVSGHL